METCQIIFKILSVVKRHISPLSRHSNDAYKDVREVKVTMKEGKYALHRPCCLPCTDANIIAKPKNKSYLQSS